MHHVGRDELAHARWKSRRLLAVVSLSFSAGETNCSQGMPITMLYFKLSSILMFDITTTSAPQNICNLFTCTQDIHQYNTRSASSGNYYINHSRLNHRKTLFPSLGLKFGTVVPKAVEDYQSTHSKRKFKHYYL